MKYLVYCIVGRTFWDTTYRALTTLEFATRYTNPPDTQILGFGPCEVVITEDEAIIVDMINQ